MIERREDDLVMPGEEMQRIAKAEIARMRERGTSDGSEPYPLHLAANAKPMKRSTWKRLAKQMGLIHEDP